MAEIYAGLPETRTLQEQQKTKRAEALNAPAVEALRKLLAELDVIEKRLADKSRPLDTLSAQTLTRGYELKRHEAQALRNEVQKTRDESLAELNREMIGEMRKNLTLVHDAALSVAKEQGFDLLFDGSGNTNTGTPFILYQGAPVDLTGQVAESLSKRSAQPVASGTNSEKP
jgi:Skp family chaperone for outer membrane proteins